MDSVVLGPQHLFPWEVVERPLIGQEPENASGPKSFQEVLRLDNELNSAAAEGNRNILDLQDVGIHAVAVLVVTAQRIFRHEHRDAAIEFEIIRENGIETTEKCQRHAAHFIVHRVDPAGQAVSFFVGAVYLRLLRGGEGAAFRVKPDVGAKARAFEGCEGDVDQQRLADGEIREGAKTAFFPDARGGIDFEDGGFRVGFLVGERDAHGWLMKTPRRGICGS